MHTPKHSCRQAPEFMQNEKKLKNKGKKSERKKRKKKTHLELSMDAFSSKHHNGIIN